ncbi:MFSD12 isoform 5 [Pongo abelii]|uniref:MFSD12 isoform 5 n=1 Tax=Pongo abelii TaxID=9601 RepID=A0A2J8SBH6_PONAB|nr:MFSD12 isoform 5 [Pongo abelii]
MVLADAAKMRSSRVRMAPNPVPGALIRRGKLGCRQEGREKAEADAGGQGVPGVAQSHHGLPEVWDRLSQPQKGPAPHTPGFQRADISVAEAPSVFAVLGNGHRHICSRPVSRSVAPTVSGHRPEGNRKNCRGRHTHEPFRNNE